MRRRGGRAAARVVVTFDVPLASVLLCEGVVLACAAFHPSDARLPARATAALSGWR